MLIMLHADKLRWWEVPSRGRRAKVATPTDGLILEAENIAEVHKILINESCLLCTVLWFSRFV